MAPTVVILDLIWYPKNYQFSIIFEMPIVSTTEALATLSLNADRDDRSPLYTQLSSQMPELIRTGGLRPGERPPSSRNLAQSLGVSRTSILMA